jgi:L-threonylcarbamoyladenylate synthase
MKHADMEPRLLDATRTDAWLPEAVASVRAGDVVALPTETFYGLAVDPRSAAAVERLLALKGHGAGRAVLLLAADVAQVDAVARLHEAEGAVSLAARFWPGPLTLVLAARGRLPAGPGGTLAIRVPGARWGRQLAAACGHPVTGTSANPAGGAPATSAAGVIAHFPRGVDRVVDGGATPGGAPSTLLDLTGNRPRLLRAGRVARPDLESVLGPIEKPRAAG